jgi:glycerophosphoryl diester phosphodiesterase
MKRLILSFVFIFPLQSLATPSCISHRGSFKSAPENSPQSMQEALDLNSDGVEFDLRHTAEGYPIVMHDKTLTTATHAAGKSCP